MLLSNCAKEIVGCPEFEHPLTIWTPLQICSPGYNYLSIACYVTCSNPSLLTSQMYPATALLIIGTSIAGFVVCQLMCCTLTCVCARAINSKTGCLDEPPTGVVAPGEENTIILPTLINQHCMSQLWPSRGLHSEINYQLKLNCDDC